MEEYITRTEFEEFKKEVRQQRHTDEIPAFNVNLASADVTNRLDTLQENANVVKVQMEGARADILQIRESQADLRDKLVEHGNRLQSIEEKQDAHTEILGKLLNFTESHDGKLTALQTDVTSIKSTQEQILQLLREKL